MEKMEKRKRENADLKLKCLYSTNIKHENHFKWFSTHTKLSCFETSLFHTIIEFFKSLKFPWDLSIKYSLCLEKKIWRKQTLPVNRELINDNYTQPFWYLFTFSKMNIIYYIFKENKILTIKYSIFRPAI